MPKLETLVDSFNTSLDKAGIWVGSSVATVWDASGRVKIPITTSYWNLATAGTGTYDLTGSYAYAKITPPAVGSGSREFFMEIIRGGVSNDKLSLFVTGTDIQAKRTLAGTVSGTFTLGTYNPTTHAWWRIRESAGTTYFDTSPNGTTWTNFWSVLNGFAVTAVWLNFTSGYWGTESASDAFVDNINTLGATTSNTSPVTDNERSKLLSSVSGAAPTDSMSDLYYKKYAPVIPETVADAQRRVLLATVPGAVATDTLSDLERKQYLSYLSLSSSVESNSDLEYRYNL